MLLSKARKTIDAHGMFVPGEKVVAAVSGGSDSMALLHVLEEMGELRLETVVAHLNHGLRGEESDADAEHARDAAGRLGLVFECRSADAEAFRKSRGLSPEDAARRLRYGFFRDVLEKHSASRIATGHTMNDQAETVVMRLLRGSGSLGLSGIRPVAGEVVRPLIDATREEAREYLRSRGVAWREDSTNSSRRFTRNRIRNELLPALETYNPAVREVLSRTAAVCSMESDFVEAEAERRFEGLVSRVAGGIFGKTRDVLSQPAAIRFSVMRKAVCELKGDLLGVSSRHLFAVEEALGSAGSSAEVDLPGEVVFRSGHGVFFLARGPESAGSVSALVEGPGRVGISRDAEVEVEVTDDDSLWGDPFAAYFPPERVSFPVAVRSFEDGDRFVPLGMKGRKKLKDFFVDEKIPRFMRKKVPLFETREGIVWVGGLRPDERFRAEKGKGPWLRMKISGPFREMLDLVREKPDGG